MYRERSRFLKQSDKLFQSLDPGADLAQNSGVGALPHQPLHHRAHILRSLKPEKYEPHIDLHLKSIISRVANSVMG